ncbi:MAG: indole-3-glycerol phosphate synthase TrpC [Sedimentisphaerales bacterium]|nr:indole-3-glycerol phosphate synthase TrpC [Sedimentisphaerales bacterium]
MENVLGRIIAVKNKEVAAAKERAPLEELQAKVKDLPKCRNFYRAIAKGHREGGIHVIAEIKRASPSAGLIRKDFDPIKLGMIYQECGADAISVLTDESFFQGKLDYIARVKEVVDVPILRKDFIIDPYQIYEARVAGADAILLIAEAVPAGELMDMMILANSLHLTVLLEVHGLDSLLQVRSMIGFPQEHYSLLGINNRNLKTMEVDLSNSLRMKEFLEDDQPIISESGIKTRSHVEQLIQAGFRGVLIGETLMRSDNIAERYRELFNPWKE